MCQYITTFESKMIISMVRRALFKLISETVININSIPINTTVFAKKAFTYHQHPAPVVA